MPLLSLAEVASRTGMARSSIYRLIDEGKLSATTDHRGRKAVELTEVLRVFGSIKNETTPKDTQEERSNNSVRTTRQSIETGQDTLLSLMQELERTRAELQFKAKELELKDRELSLMLTRVEELKATNEQATSEKNRFLEIIERQSLLLAAPTPATPVRKRTTPTTKPVASKVTGPKKQTKPLAKASPKTVTKKAAAADTAKKAKAAAPKATPKTSPKKKQALQNPPP